MAALPRPPLNIVPAALLSLFEIKSGGQAPQHLNAELVPTIDLLYQYLVARAVAHISQDAPLVANTASQTVDWTGATPVLPVVGGAVVVPDDEYWWIVDGSLRWLFTATAGLEFDGQFVWRNPTTNNMNNMLPTTLQGFTTSLAAYARSGSRSIAAGNPTLIPPGSTLGMRVHGATVPAGSVTFQTTLRLVRLKA